MEAVHKKLLEFMANKNHFIIPKYQRNYAWDRSQCERLFDDIADVHHKNLKTYFLGAFVVVSERSNELILIDGQQRLTSISLLMLAICNLLKNKKIKSKDEFLSEAIWEDYLINKRSKNLESYIRLKQVNQDSTAYESLFKEDANLSDSIKQTAIYKNYRLFEQKVKYFCKRYSIDDLWKAFSKLQIVQIELKTADGDKPQVVFETINSTGKRLADADLIRNYILMDRPQELQNRWFDDYWQKIEKNTLFIEKGKQVPRTTKAIWYYLMHKNKRFLEEKYVYLDFKKHINDLSQQNNDLENIEQCLMELVEYTQYYRWFAFSCPEPPLEHYFSLFRVLNQTTPYPYFMGLMDLYKTGKLSLKTVCKVLDFIKNYYIRRAFISLPTNIYNNLYPNLYHRINKNLNEDYLSSLYRVFANFSHRDRYPDNKEIIKEMPFYNPVYGSTKTQLCKTVLSSICNHNSKERIDINDGITIEHIMPQNLPEWWKKELGDDWKEVHEKYLHTIGNLTLTGYNPKHSNKPFTEKKRLMKEYSNISLNKYFDEVEVWNEKAIQDRAEDMTHLFNKVFPDIEDREQYKQYDDTEWVPLQSFDTTRTKIEAYKLIGEIQNLKNNNWGELLQYVLIKLYDLDNEPLLNYSHTSTWFSNDKENLPKPLEIANNLYVEGTKSSRDIANCLQKVLKEYGLQDEFFVKLK